MFEPFTYDQIIDYIDFNKKRGKFGALIISFMHFGENLENQQLILDLEIEQSQFSDLQKREYTLHKQNNSDQNKYIIQLFIALSCLLLLAFLLYKLIKKVQKLNEEGKRIEKEEKKRVKELRKLKKMEKKQKQLIKKNKQECKQIQIQIKNNKIIFDNLQEGKYIQLNSEIDTNNINCPVCQQLFVNQDRLKICYCQHRVHYECLQKWIINLGNLQCPICNNPVDQIQERKQTFMSNFNSPPNSKSNTLKFDQCRIRIDSQSAFKINASGNSSDHEIGITQGGSNTLIQLNSPYQNNVSKNSLNPQQKSSVNIEMVKSQELKSSNQKYKQSDLTDSGSVNEIQNKNLHKQK